MNIKIGEKIKQLRQRDGRKQEDLANALGVSSQAISRWEANGGYPDMELIPAIANYFNISIDELFGYSKDRQEKLKSILEKAEKAINEQGDMTECVEMLRAAAEEFPSEPQVLIKLGYALFPIKGIIWYFTILLYEVNVLSLTEHLTYSVSHLLSHSAKVIRLSSVRSTSRKSCIPSCNFERTSFCVLAKKDLYMGLSLDLCPITMRASHLPSLLLRTNPSP